jgi:hypothetical protein
MGVIAMPEASSDMPETLKMQKAKGATMIRYIPESLSYAHLSLDSFISYLQSTSWRRVEYKDQRRIIFAHDEEEGESPSLVALPVNDKFRDFPTRIAEAVMRVADVEQVSPQDVVRRIQSLEKETSRYLQKATQHLEETADKDFEEDRTVRGFITNLSFEKPTDNGTITISTEEWGKVSFSATPDEYIAACSARGEGQIISVRGKLVKHGKRQPWELLNPHDFHLQEHS